MTFDSGGSSDEENAPEPVTTETMPVRVKVDTDAGASDVRSYGAAPPAAPTRVLVADGDPSVVATLTGMLEDAGYETFSTTDGLAAIDALTRDSFDVVLTEIGVPGITGIELLSVVRAYDFDVPVLLMAAEPTVETAVQAVRLGATQYLKKPIHMTTLLDAVEHAAKLLHAARTRRAAMRLLEESTQQARERAALVETFERALETLWIAFHPILRVGEGERRVLGYEARALTDEPSLPAIDAMREAAKKLGRIAELGRRVRNAAGRSFAPDAENALLFVSVPPEDLAGPELLDPESPLGAIAARVVLQVSDRARLAETLAPTVTADLRGRGYRLAVDELGAGQASLAAIALLLPEFVKIDATLVHGVHASDVRKRLVEAMVRAARELACEIVADGVEAPEDRDALLAIGCEVQQGPLFADPLSP